MTFGTKQFLSTPSKLMGSEIMLFWTPLNFIVRTKNIDFSNMFLCSTDESHTVCDHMVYKCKHD